MRAPLTAADVAALVEGRLTDGVGGGAPLMGVAPLDQAGPHDLSFLSSKKYLADFHASQAGAVLVTGELAAAQPGPAVRIVVPDPHKAMLAVLRELYPAPPRPAGVHPTARIGAGASLGEGAAVGAYAVIGDGCRIGARAVIMESAVLGAGVIVGDDAVLHPQVVCYAGTVLGARVILHAGVRLGVDGFGYVQTPAGHERVPHVGGCRVEDDVEIGANTCVDRGSIGDTVIGAGTKIDNLVHIGHNCRIGRRCLIMGQVGLAGSTCIEDEVILAGQVGVAGHLTVGARARVTAQSGISMDVAQGDTMSGYPARRHRDAMRANAAMYRLAKIVHEIEELVERERKHD